VTSTERARVADELLGLLASQAATPADRVIIVGMLAAKAISADDMDPRGRGSAVKSLTNVMNAQLTLETAGEHRAVQPVGRLSTEDDE
jgi:hypothetical protein